MLKQQPRTNERRKYKQQDKEENKTESIDSNENKIKIEDAPFSVEDFDQNKIEIAHEMKDKNKRRIS